MNASHAQAAGKRCDQRANNGKSNEHDNQQREARKQGADRRLQNGMDDGNESSDENH